MSSHRGYQKILVGIDFSPQSSAALQQALWLARRCGARIVLAHALPDLRQVVHSASAGAKLDLLYGEGERFHREVRQKSDDHMRRLIESLQAPDLDTRCETLLGEPFVEIIHAVQQEGYDLVLAGTRSLAPWKQFLVGSTAKRLIRKCPASVWIVKAENVGPPRAILGATDFSEISRKAVLEGLWLAQQASARFHLLHVIDSADIPDDLLGRIPNSSTLLEAIDEQASQRLEEFVGSLPVGAVTVERHLFRGTPWEVIRSLTEQMHIDLIAMGTVGRSGINGLLLGNTAEKVLSTCDCSILTVKTDQFVSPILPACWELHPRSPRRPGSQNSPAKT
jgi:nucleotide-binding universal stress UspA family protein